MLDDLRTDSDKALDASAVKRDDFDHARESLAGLKQLARRTLNPERSSEVESKVRARLRDPYRRAKRVNRSVPTASTYVTEQLIDAGIWLQANREAIGIPEIEMEDGRLNGARREINEANYGMATTDFNNPDLSNYESAGLLYVGQRTCYTDLDTVAQDLADADPIAVSRADGVTVYPYRGVDAYRRAALKVRGKTQAQHRKRMDERMRWRGMEEWDAVAKADERLAQGLKRKAITSNAKPLPELSRLRELYDVRDGQLVHKRLNRVVTGRRVNVDGQLYVPSRIAFAIETGKDPADKVVVGGVATNLSRATGGADYVGVVGGEDKWRSRVEVGGESITVGRYDSEDTALKAAQLYIKSLDWGLVDKK